MHGLFAGLTTLDVAHGLDSAPDPLTKTTSTAHLLAAGGPATNAAVTFSALCRVARVRGTGSEGDEGDVATLLTAVGRGPLSDVVRADLAKAGVDVLDATELPDGPPPLPADADSRARGLEPALSSIVEHPEGRMVVSTNARLPLDVVGARTRLAEDLLHMGDPDVVLVDGHNPELAALALRVGTRDDGASEDPFAELEEHPSHLRVLDGGSWKPWFTPLLGLVDVAVVSADFRPPVLSEADGDATAAFLRGFGITRVVRTDGANPVRWWWDGAEGEVPVVGVAEASTLGAGDVFHGALAWALARLHAAELAVPQDPTPQITFAASVATLSTCTFGTRTWRSDPRLAELLEGI
ncbi:PfkB family carbohydrate kinase [Actinomyces polynesiensis]|uniref:PfkB family carbohydrate kinase n=1 Tax=Actinomyces polynesiensis TaxID=1325934 RepID=UPI00069476A9|nr:PfkB family carbohydrate kinase [Actinomyces polynesiensis]